MKIEEIDKKELTDLKYQLGTSSVINKIMNQITIPTFKKYPAYKDSGVEWLGEIPEHWEIIKFKHIFQEKKKVSNSLLNCGAISFGKVVYKDDDKIPETTKTSYQEVLEGEFLINPLNLNYDLISLRIGLSEINVVVSSGYIVLKNIIDIDKTYFKYLLHRYDVAYMKLLGSGVRQTINFNHIANSILAFPPLQEQTAIANFLDDKTVKIDHVIAQKEKMITLLKERKQIIIQDLVTGKKVWNDTLNTWTEPGKVKDSGVEWIGEIPVDWEVKRLKYLGNIYSGLSGKSGEDFSKEYNVKLKPFVPFINICNNLKIDVSHYQYVKISKDENQNRVNKYDLLFLMSSETLEDIGKNSIYLGNDKELYLNSFCKGFRLDNDKALPVYVNYLLNSKSYRAYFSIVGRGFTRINLKQEYINDVCILLPTLKEQTAIASFLDDKTVNTDKAIVLQEQQISKLKELKSTLIDSAVTGKIKV